MDTKRLDVGRTRLSAGLIHEAMSHFHHEGAAFPQWIHKNRFRVLLTDRPILSFGPFMIHFSSVETKKKYCRNTQESRLILARIRTRPLPVLQGSDAQTGSPQHLTTFTTLLLLSVRSMTSERALTHHHICPGWF
ncbi:hypothetical protein FQA47_022182 [Oryzias melastigma]|uniref:Uncharacterized protein n=1 Tax=Oryzias melastigma TaxID=30732 RepID=A0A834FNN5_ORYME|nr:hypothetical protein FQA47_022182 [Oryzias melastigma]